MLRGSPGDAHDLAVDGAGERLVLALGVDHRVVDSGEQGAQRIELVGVGLAGSGLCEDDAVGVLAAEQIEDDGTAGGALEADEDPLAVSGLAGGEGHQRGEGGGVQVAEASQIVLTGREAGEQPGQHLEQRRSDRCELRVERRLGLVRGLVQRGGGLAVDAHVRRGLEDTLVTALDRDAQALHVVVGKLRLDRGEAARSLAQPA